MTFSPAFGVSNESTRPAGTSLKPLTGLGPGRARGVGGRPQLGPLARRLQSISDEALVTATTALAPQAVVGTWWAQHALPATQPRSSRCGTAGPDGALKGLSTIASAEMILLAHDHSSASRSINERHVATAPWGYRFR